jgi:hypothetical protein
VVNVANRANVDVRFRPFKLCLCHRGPRGLGGLE